jgi:hypothetical protein
MPRLNSSNAALALSAVALFVALGGTAVAVSGQVTTSQIKNAAVTNHKIANAAVGNHKIANGAIGNRKLADNSVGTNKLQNGAVTASKLAAGAVSGAVVGTGVIGTNNLAGSSVTSSKLAPNSVLTASIADGSVTTSKLADNAVTNSKLADNSVSTTKLTDNAVTTTKLADASVTNSKLAPDSVTTDKVQDGSLTAADIAPNTFVAGVGSVASGRVVVAPGSEALVLDLGFGRIVGLCSAANVPTLGFTPFVNGVNIVDWFTNFGGTSNIVTTNNQTAGTTYEQPNAASGPQSVTWQVGFNDGVSNHVATANTSGQFLAATGCVFMGQGTTTG